jgi:hypothetical protein
MERGKHPSSTRLFCSLCVIEVSRMTVNLYRVLVIIVVICVVVIFLIIFAVQSSSSPAASHAAVSAKSKGDCSHFDPPPAPESRQNIFSKVLQILRIRIDALAASFAARNHDAIPTQRNRNTFVNVSAPHMTL